MSKLNLLHQPLEQETLDARAKMSDDFANVSLLAIPVVILGNAPIGLKIINMILLAALIYGFLVGSRIIRQAKQKQEKHNGSQS